jgi:hypothetical protein
MVFVDTITIISTTGACAMQTLTSREVQNQYGNFLEAMQDDIVCVTRHGRPLFWAMSEREVRGDPSVLIGRAMLMRGQAKRALRESEGRTEEGADVLREVLNAIDASSSGETMTEEEVMQFVHDNRI